MSPEKTTKDAPKTGRPKAKKLLAQKTVDDAVDWNQYMTGKGFADVRYVLDDEGGVAAAIGFKDGQDHEITATLRKMFGG